MNDRFLVDECLSVALVAAAKGRGFPADHVTYLGKSGWQDRSLAAFALENDYIVVTNNRRHFLREYAKLDVHCGLIILVPAVSRSAQLKLFERALDIVAARDGGLVNKVLEMLADESAHVREWDSGVHALGPITNPAWR